MYSFFQFECFLKQETRSIFRSRYGRTLPILIIGAWIIIAIIHVSLFPNTNTQGILTEGGALLISLVLALNMPAGIITSGFAEEKEKRTFETLLVLPIKRQRIFYGKILSGMIMVSLLILLNIISMFIVYPLLVSVLSNNIVLDLSIEFRSMGSLMLSMFLTSFVGLTLGFAITSFVSSKEQANNLYMFFVVVPGLLILNFDTYSSVIPTSLTNGIDMSVLWFLVPWVHITSLFRLVAFSSSTEMASLTGLGITGDVIFHLSFIILVLFATIQIASHIFEKEWIIND